MKRIASMLLALTLCAGAASAKGTSVVGTWQGDKRPVTTFMFLKDGTVVMSQQGAEISNIAGKWSQLPDGRYMLQFTGMYGTQAAFAHMEDGTLVLEDRPPTRLRRVK